MDAVRQLFDIARDPRQSKWISPLLIAVDAALCGVIIWKVPYTEIDWKAYMQQIALYIKGERNYYNIEGDTGPLVYPGLHVYIYRALYTLTNHGKSIFTAQIIFAILYLGTLSVVMACYRQAKAPPYIFPLLILSKRLHSIYMLRLFNDCWAVLFLWLCIYFYQRKYWTVGTAFYSCGLGVKMSVLLVLPALGFVLLQAIGQERSITQALVITQTQGAWAYEFVRMHWRAYVFRSFQLNRQFLYQWTVNWRFVPVSIFLSSQFSYSLLAAHAALLLLFASTRWTVPSRRSLPGMLKLFLDSDADWRETEEISDRIKADWIMTTMLTANAIGMLCARSLHYQFYSWLCWTTPYLLWKSGLHPIFVVGVWASQEWAWNVYPSTDASSTVVVGVLAVQVLAIWWGGRKDWWEPKENGAKKNE